MGEESALYGCIFGSARGPHAGATMAGNARVIATLPVTDEYPQLTRNMFSITATAFGEPGLYRAQTIPFGASFKDISEHWDIWLRKFERLLAKLAWEKAELRLFLPATVEHEHEREFLFTWVLNGQAGGWTFSGGPREFGQQIQRFRSWIPEAEGELLREPKNVDLLARLVGAYDRVGAEEKARQLYERLVELDPERAAKVAWI